MKSAHTGQTHELIIVYPDSYWKNPDKKYPVLYFTDGYWDTPLLAGAYGNLVYDKMAPEFIMVGLSYPDGTDYGSARVRDYTYTSMLMVPGSGKGDQFLDFLEKEVAPLIESKYHGDKDNRTLAGASLGGLFTLGAAMKTPDFFTGYIALSPAVFWDGGAVFKLEEALAKQHPQLKARMFIAVGSLEPAQFRGSIEQFEKQLASHQYKDLQLQSYTIEGMGHGTSKAEGYMRGLKWVWQNR
ncbi:enterochelin esterase, putative [Ricinus communis]|uniref:Enterochelin esterase, putative n=1 Tax=Ricinus communis TaxID=3988 RepID=B9TMJ3_RICCO|nr:enterochelin esterase, putative [Ricinus communis]